MAGIDGQAHSRGARDGGRPHAERQHVGVGGEHAVARDDAGDAVTLGAERAHPRAEPDGGAVLLAADAGQRLREHARIAARVAEIPDGAGDLPAHRLEDGIQAGEGGGVEDLLLLPVLGEERHLLDPRLELGGITVEVEGAPVNGLVLDALRAHHLVEHALAVLAEPQLDERVAPGARRRALAQEAQPPRVELGIGVEPDSDRGLPAPQRLPQHARVRAGRPTRRSGRGR